MFKMKNKNLFLGLIFSLFVISILPMVLATGTVTWVAPTDGGVITGSNFAFNLTNATGLVDITNCTITISSTSTATSTSMIFFNTSSTMVSGKNDTTVWEDSNDYTLSATCYNYSAGVSTTNSITISVDNDLPDTPTSLTPTANSIDTDGSVTFSATVNDSETTGCTLYFPGINPGASSYAMTYATTSCTYSLTVPDQTFDYYIRASDGTNTTDSSTLRFNVNRQSTDDYMYQNDEVVPDTQSQTNEFSITDTLGGNGVIIGWVIGIILIIVILYIVFKR